MKTSIASLFVIAALQGCIHSNLETRQYEVKLNFLQPEFVNTDAQISDMGEFTSMGQISDDRPLSEQVSIYLEKAGVSRPTGSFVRIDTNNSILVARNTPVNLDQMERILVPLGESWILKRKND